MKTVQPGSRALLTVRGSCSFAGLGYMKLCYADPQLKVSKEEFEKTRSLYKSGFTLLQSKRYGRSKYR
jgi:hypothetical protein